MIVLRRHAGRAPAWLPNPISKSGDELGGLKAALAQAGLRILRDEKLKTGSQGLVASYA